MKRLLYLSAIAAIALGTIAAGSALAVETKKGVSPKSATPPQTFPGIVPPFVLELATKQDTMMSTGYGLRATLSYRLPKEVNQNCDGKATFSANGNKIGEAALGPIIKQSADGPGHTKYERRFWLPQKWLPPAWKAGKYEIGVQYTGGGSCPALTGKYSFTLKHAETNIFLNTPATVGPLMSFQFKASLKKAFVPNANDPVKGVPIKASVCGITWPSQTTDATGRATFSGQLPFEWVGPQKKTTCPNPFPVTVVFEGNDVYQKASAEKKVPLQ